MLADADPAQFFTDVMVTLHCGPATAGDLRVSVWMSQPCDHVKRG